MDFGSLLDVKSYGYNNTLNLPKYPRIRGRHSLLFVNFIEVDNYGWQYGFRKFHLWLFGVFCLTFSTNFSITATFCKYFIYYIFCNSSLIFKHFLKYSFETICFFQLLNFISWRKAYSLSFVIFIKLKSLCFQFNVIRQKKFE